jgi:hypothetical protein
VNFRTTISGVAQKNGGHAETPRQWKTNMLNVLDRVSEDKAEPTFTDRELKAHRDFLTRKISRAEASGQPFAEIVTISPELAHLILQRNPADENRKLSLETVTKYATDMANGRWKGLNGQTIVISKDGYLNDGQHRLNAIIECGGNIPFTVVFGAERESRMTLDQNKVRTSGDYINMAGIKNGNKVAAIAALIHGYENGVININKDTRGVASHDKPTKAFLHRYALDRLTNIETALHFCDKKEVRKLTTDTRMATCLYLVAEKAGLRDALDFFESVIGGENLGKTNPAYTVRERLFSERLAGMVPVSRTMEIIFRGWNAHRRGDRLAKMSLRGELPEIEG